MSHVYLSSSVRLRGLDDLALSDDPFAPVPGLTMAGDAAALEVLGRADDDRSRATLEADAVERAILRDAAEVYAFTTSTETERPFTALLAASATSDLTFRAYRLNDGDLVRVNPEEHRTWLPDATDNVWRGSGGDDRMVGRGGADRFYGGFGDDTIEGGAGGDLLIGDGTGFGVSGGPISSRGGPGAGNDVIRGGGGDDAILGGDLNDRLFGNRGADTMAGGTGDDVLKGGPGRDVLFGGAGAGLDRLTGGGQADLFVFGDWRSETEKARIVVTDWQDGVDRILVDTVLLSQSAPGAERATPEIRDDGADAVIENWGTVMTIRGAAGLIDEDDFEIVDRRLDDATLDIQIDLELIG